MGKKFNMIYCTQEYKSLLPLPSPVNNLFVCLIFVYFVYFVVTCVVCV